MSTIEAVESNRKNRSVLESALKAAGCDLIKGNVARCPFHDDRHPSGSIYQGEDGAWRFKCMTSTCDFGGDYIDVQSRTSGRRPEEMLADLGKTDKAPAKKPKFFSSLDLLKQYRHYGSPLDKCYTYVDPTFKAIDMVVMRFTTPEGKSFIQARPVGDGFELKAPEKPWPLYNRSRLSACDAPVIVEGEKCVHALAEIGIVATTSPGGAKNAGNADWRPLDGKREIILWRDNDAAGLAYMQEVAAIVGKLSKPPIIRWIDVEGSDVPEKGDCVDCISIYGDGDPVEAKRYVDTLLLTAESVGPSNVVGKMIEDSIAGLREAVPWPWSNISFYTQALLPGTVTVLCGAPGGGKSLFIMECIRFWISIKISVAVYELEDDLEHHLNRAVAQMARNPNLTQASWIKKNPDPSRAAYQKYREALDAVGACIDTSPEAVVPLDELGAWVARMAESGKRIIVVDPVTAAESGSKPWIGDKDFIIKAKAVVRRHGCSLLIVTHPRMGTKGVIGIENIAGGAAYARFPHTILWLQFMEEAKNYRIHAAGPFNCEVSRILRIIKARNARGQGRQLAYHLDPETFAFHELGVIIGDSNE